MVSERILRWIPVWNHKKKLNENFRKNSKKSVERDAFREITVRILQDAEILYEIYCRITWTEPLKDSRFSWVIWDIVFVIAEEIHGKICGVISGVILEKSR